MKFMHFCCFAGLVIVFLHPSIATAKNTSLIVGKWKLVKFRWSEFPNREVDPGGTFEFLEDGICVIHFLDQGRDIRGTYEIKNTKSSKRIFLKLYEETQESPSVVSGTYRFVGTKLLMRLVAKSTPSLLLMIPTKGGTILMEFDRIQDRFSTQ